MKLTTINTEVKNIILKEVMEVLENNSKSINFPKNATKIDDTCDDNGYQFKPRSLSLITNENGKKDIQISYTYYDTYLYEDLGLPKYSRIRQGEKTESSLSIFNINDILNVIYVIPKKYNIKATFLSSLRKKINKLIKDELIKNNDILEFSSMNHNSYMLASLWHIELKRISLEKNKIYVTYNDIYEDCEEEMKDELNSMGFIDVFYIASLLNENLSNEN